MEGDEVVEFHDWEVLQKSEDGGPVVNSDNFVGIESESDGVIRSDYFSIDGQRRYAKTVAEGDVSEEGSVESDNPSWIDPAMETGYGKKNSSEFWSDSSSDPSEERKSGDFDTTNELGVADIMGSQLGFGGIGEMDAENKKSGEFRSAENKLSDLDVIKESDFVNNSKSQVGFQDLRDIQIWDESLEKCYSDSGGGDLEYGNKEKLPEASEFSSELDAAINAKKLIGEENSVESETVAVAELKADVKSDGEGEKRRIVWWKVPFEVLKYCVFRVSPVWSLSVAAALMGFIILGRKLYRMKRKSQSLKLNVTVDDKKVSQIMGRAARLNEAFSIVRRVPIIRPSLPASGVTPWPMMSMR